MKKIFFLIQFLIFIIFSGNFLFSQTDTTLKNYPGIPLVTYLYNLGGLPSGYSGITDKVDSLGIHTVIINDLTSGVYNNFNLGNRNFKIIPNQVTESVVYSGYNLINKYTEAKYSIWQAEGTPPEDGEASVFMNDTFTVKAENDTVIRTDTIYIPEGTELINGPSYQQEGSYFMVKPDTNNVIQYRADFYMKIEELIPQVSLPSDTICIIQVTASHIDVGASGWEVFDYRVVEDSAILFGDFNSVNQWQDFLLEYDLTGLADSFYNYGNGKTAPPPMPTPGWDPGLRNTVQNVEYKIIWKGNSELVRLYVDKIILYDERGQQLTDPITGPLIKDDILNMVEASYITSNYQTKFSGWIGLDEPGSIDCFEPIRIVNELIESHPGKAKLWIQGLGSWSGSFGAPWSISAGERVNKIE